MQIIAQDRELTMGLDVHETKVAVTVVDGDGEIVKTATVPYEHKAVEHFIARFPGCRVRSVYEAGPMGYWLHDTLESLGVDSTVTPPSKTPRSQDDRVKTDRRDSRKLARLHRHGLLKAVNVLPPRQRAERQLTRTREQLMKMRTQLMARLRSMLRMHHVQRPDGVGKPWSRSYLHWLRQESFQQVEGGAYLRICLDAYLQQYEQLTCQCKALLKEIVALSETPAYARRSAALQTLPGIGPQTAQTVLTELPSVGDFDTSGQFTGFLGLVPGESSSGDVQHRGPITRAGNAHIRRLLVQCAWRWIAKDNAAYSIFRQIARRREKKRAIVAMARRLAVRIYWLLRNLDGLAAARG